MLSSFQSRPMAMGARGAVASPHLLASQAALDALRSGGNAADAAVVAAAVSAVVQPFTSSIAGVGWASAFDAASRTSEILAFHGVVPSSLDPARLEGDGSTGLVDWRSLEAHGASLLGSLVPGAVLGWEELLSRKGRWTLARALEPAHSLATEGFPVSQMLAETVARNSGRLARWPSSAAVYLPEGRPIGAGMRLVQTDLGSTLGRIAANGSPEMTQGATALAMLKFFADHGGALSASDLSSYRPSWHRPLSSSLRGYTVLATPPPLGDVSFASGLQLLDSLEPFPGFLDPSYIHFSVESAKLVSADRARYLGADADPALVEMLLSGEHTKALGAEIADAARPPGLLSPPAEDTITLAVVDEEGNAVHLMQTVGTLFGSAAIVAGAGFFANSSLYFAYVRPGSANRVIPGRGIEQNPCLSSLFDGDGNLFLVLGSPGGKTRVETVRQMLANVIDFKMNLQQAVDAPRFLVSLDGEFVEFEGIYGPIDPELEAALALRGHRVRLSDERFGSGQAIAIDPLSGTRMAAADWRRESVALAY